MAEAYRPTILCLSSYFKGEALIEECKRGGAHVMLMTRDTLVDAAWPRESIDEFFSMPDLSLRLDVIHAVSYLARTRAIDQIVPLDEYDAEMAAALREHFRLPGIGESAVRYFRDKLAMRLKAGNEGIPVPDFVAVFNHDRLREFMDRVPAPWLLKPRSEAGTMGIKKINTQEELWPQIEAFGDRQSFYLLERYLPGDVYHVDSLIYDREVVFSIASRYGRPPMDVAHEGGVFITRLLPYDSEESEALVSLNRQLIGAFGLEHGVTHAEFIRSHADGRFYFLEIAARVGGGHISTVVETATGINLWAEWGRIELDRIAGKSYQLPEVRQEYASLLLCLARQESPDLSSYQDPEVAWRLQKEHHAGLIVASSDPERIESLVDSYSHRFADDFLAVEPLPDRPTE